MRRMRSKPSMNTLPPEACMIKIFVSLISVGLMMAATAKAEQIRFICSGTHVEYDGWGKRVEQMSSLKEDPVDLMVDTTAGKIHLSTMYGGPVTAELKTSPEWFEAEVQIGRAHV